RTDALSLCERRGDRGDDRHQRSSCRRPRDRRHQSGHAGDLLRRRAMGRNIFAALTLTLLFAAAAQAQLVDIATNATDPNNLVDAEPSIAVNPLNPSQM